MAYTIWGYNRFGQPRCYALHVPPSEERAYLERAKKEGWTGLVVDRKPQPSLFGEDNPNEQHEPTTKE